jgi:hypothetical protein
MTMALLNASLRTELRNVLVALPRPVTVLVFVGAACDTCGETRELVEELASISEGMVRLEVHDLDAHPPEATLYRVDKAPAIVVLGGETGRRGFGIRFYGSPAGYEFATLIEDIRMASRGTTDLSCPWRIRNSPAFRRFRHIGYAWAMRDLAVLILHLVATVARLAGTGGVCAVVAESLLLKQQLLILNRSRTRAPRLRVHDRIVAGACALLIAPGAGWCEPPSS